jgi:hypothetical protein
VLKSVSQIDIQCPLYPPVGSDVLLYMRAFHNAHGEKIRKIIILCSSSPRIYQRSKRAARLENSCHSIRKHMVLLFFWTRPVSLEYRQPRDGTRAWSGTRIKSELEMLIASQGQTLAAELRYRSLVWQLSRTADSLNHAIRSSRGLYGKISCGKCRTKQSLLAT